MKDLVETEVRELLSECDYPGDSVTVVVGSGLKVLQSSGPDPKILEVVKMLDSWDPSA
jgi:translation elongation factor EF-Tu-like GTPase